MKKSVSILLIFLITLSILSGCGKKESPRVSVTPPAPVLETPAPQYSVNEKNTPETTETPIEESESEETKSEETETKSEETETEDLEFEVVEGSEEEFFNRKDSQEFNESLIHYLKVSGYKNQNFMVSPLSLRAALCLLTEGAVDKTEEVLLNSLAFNDKSEMQNWYYNILNSITDFNGTVRNEKEYRERLFLESYGLSDIKELTESEDEELKEELLPIYEKYMNIDWNYNIANSIWINTDKNVHLSDEYSQNVKRIYDADAYNSPYSTINEDVDKWVYEKTNGFIPRLGVNLINTPITLINTLYLKSPWEVNFSKSDKAQYFRKYDDSKIDKNYIETTAYLEHYRDNDTELVVVPLKNNLKFVAIMGEDSNLNDLLSKTNREYINLIMPEFEISNKFENRILIDYFTDCGFLLPFNNLADYSKMVEDSSKIIIDDIIQVTKINLNETGLEASAVTITVTKGNFFVREEGVLRIIYDIGYSFYIVDGNNDNEVLFYGQIVE